jgi:lipopolysaccharide/colanic/teichoic acid biosynthesis glycosyltransferase
VTRRATATQTHPKRSSKRLKRAFDLVGGALVLIAMAPIMAVIALAIHLDSPGAAIFRQWRIGRGGESFQIYKFRTMVDEAEQLKDHLRDLSEADGLFKIREDPRITRVGGVLRRTSVDELPQLFNVLRGSMSLVGPHPAHQPPQLRFHSAAPLIALVYLCCSGIVIDLPR